MTRVNRMLDLGHTYYVEVIHKSCIHFGSPIYLDTIDGTRSMLSYVLRSIIREATLEILSSSRVVHPGATYLHMYLIIDGRDLSVLSVFL